MRQAVSIQFILCYLLLCISCKSKKYIFEGVDQRIDPSQIPAILGNHNIEYNWYAAKAKFKFESKGISESGTSYIRVKKDSVVWMALKKFSIEGLRVQMTPDSFTVIDRINKEVLSLDWEEMRSWYRMPIDFRMMQDLVVGNIRLEEDEEIKYEEIDSIGYKVKQVTPFLDYTYSIPYFEQRVNSFTMEDMFARLLQVTYENCSTDEGYCFERVYTISSKETQEIYLSLKISNLELNEPKKIKFDIPSHYTWL